ncbi:NAD(P)-binding domain-containing protein, partial [Nocardiopsis lucentensis]|uniref:NAD(P)-binding domain-containing protein n=1 Tax=Nocardiopsis lucentensis TaxID=53441 RepID=UPI0005937926
MTEPTTPEGVDIAGRTVAVLGGTGDQGRGLARRFALAGHSVLIGSRSAERAA